MLIAPSKIELNWLSGKPERSTVKLTPLIVESPGSMVTRSPADTADQIGITVPGGDLRDVERSPLRREFGIGRIDGRHPRQRQVVPLDYEDARAIHVEEIGKRVRTADDIDPAAVIESSWSSGRIPVPSTTNVTPLVLVTARSKTTLPPPWRRSSSRRR